MRVADMRLDGSSSADAGQRADSRRARTVCGALALAVAAVLLSACGDDGKESNFQTQPDADGSIDMSADMSGDLLPDQEPDMFTPPDMGTDFRGETDVEPNFDVEEDVVEPGEDDFLCNRDARVEACQAALLQPAEPPTDPAELLFYVNRWYDIPADYPISAESTWTPCFGGDPGVEHDLVCLPSPFTPGSAQALRQIAWESDAPPMPDVTHDGKPVGYMGKVGFRALFDAAFAEAGYEIFVLSGFRSFATQQATFNGHKANEISGGLTEEEAELVASTYSAQPGHSEHQLGTTADITYRQANGLIFPGLDQSMGNAAPVQWVDRNAHRFGVVLTYGEAKVATTQYVYEPWHHRFVGVEAADAMRECQLNTEEFLAARYGVGELPMYAGEPLILYRESDMRNHTTHGPGSWVQPGEAFTKTWEVKNTGSINWSDYELRRIGPDVFGGQSRSVTCVPAGQTVSLSVEMTAPQMEGTYEEVWQVHDENGQPFGDELVVRLVVSEEEPEADPYLYVRIDDLSNATGGGDPGADLDAVVLEKNGGMVVYAEAVESYLASPADVNANNPQELLGAPDAFTNWPDVSTCRVDSGFVSLGGAGYAIVRMGQPVEEGDRLDVLEIGGCEYAPGSDAIPDQVEVQVAVTSALDGQWIALGRGTGPLISFSVPSLPALSAP